MRLRVLTWNLMHGRSVPGSGRDLLDRFAAALQGWEWDVALLQEVPPWWPALLGERLGAEHASVLTSRNALLPARRFAAVRRPDLMRSGGGSANAMLARHDRIVVHRQARLCRWPERRWAHGIELGYGIWLVNLHATAHNPDRARRDVALAARHARAWAGSLPLVLGGDFNLGAPSLERLGSVADSDVDHVLIDERCSAIGPAQTLDRGDLSDHVPLAVTLAVGGA